MTIPFSGFAGPRTAVSGDIVVGLHSAGNEQYFSQSWLFTANNLSDVANALTSFNNLSPLTTEGDLLYYHSGANARLAIGASTDILQSNGTIPAWVANPGLLIASNLSDLNSISTAVTNLGFPATASHTLSAGFATPDTAADLIWVDVACTSAALATAGKVQIAAAAGTKQYKIRDVRVNYSASGLSGSSGDRLLSITDGTTVYNSTGITAALLGTPVNTLWGGTGNPVAGTVAMNTSSVAGAQIYVQYIGGTIDYSAGTVNLSVQLQRVA